MQKYNSKDHNKKILEEITKKIDKKIIKNFGDTFNELVKRALKSYEENAIDYDLFTINKNHLNKILETAHTLRKETSKEKIKKEYKKQQAKYLYDTIKEYSHYN